MRKREKKREKRIEREKERENVVASAHWKISTETWLMNEAVLGRMI